MTIRYKGKKGRIYNLPRVAKVHTDGAFLYIHRWVPGGIEENRYKLPLSNLVSIFDSVRSVSTVRELVDVRMED